MNRNMSPEINEKIQKAKEITQAQTTETLIESFEMTSDMKISAEVAMTRGWIMDELDKRNPEAFEKWMDSCENSPRQFYTD